MNLLLPKGGRSLLKIAKDKMRSALVLTVALWCSLASFNAKAQTADTLRLSGSYSNGVIIRFDTLLTQFHQVEIPQNLFEIESSNFCQHYISEREYDESGS
jgi:hypothetical protein